MQPPAVQSSSALCTGPPSVHQPPVPGSAVKSSSALCTGPPSVHQPPVPESDGSGALHCLTRSSVPSDMAPSAALVSILLAALLASPPVTGSNHTVFAVSKSGLMHLDSSGALLAWRPDTGQTGQVATNPQNGTVCWMRRQRDPEHGGERRFSVRCAELSRLNQTWDLPLPLTFATTKVREFAFERVAQNWYLTVGEDLHLARKDGALHYDVFRSYVCSYLFDKCHQLVENVPDSTRKFFAAYDISNRLATYITAERYSYGLRLMQLDGSGVHDLDTYIRQPLGLALDPVGRHIYWMGPPFPKGNAIDLNRIDYDGKNRRRVKRVYYDKRNIKAFDAVGGTVVLLRNNRSTISVVDGATGEMTDLVAGAVKGGESIPALAKVDGLLAVNIVSHDTQLETENLCSSTSGDCQDFCIPTMANNTAAATCVCPEGLQLVDLECRKEHPSFALVVGANSLQAVDLQTEQVTTILSNLTDGTKVDVYRVADAEFLLFWLDAGSLFQGRWSPGGSVTDVQLLVPATETVRVVDVAVYAGQHQLFWMKKDDSDASAGSSMVVQMSPLDGSYVKTVLVSNWKDQQDQVTHSAFLLIGSQFVRQRAYWVTLLITSKTSRCSNSTLDVEDLADIVMDEPLSQNPLLYRTFWIDRATQSIEYIYYTWAPFYEFFARDAGRGRSRLLTHPSLADAGGLDMTDSRLFWTERSSGRLWTADSETGGGVRSLLGVTAGRSLRLIQPWRRPTIAPVCDENRAGCSHFCRRFTQGFNFKPLEAKCDCPDGMQLGDDQKTCQGADINATGGSGSPLGCQAWP